MPNDPRTYITVHDGMPEHPKVEGLSDGAFRLLVTCWCWCSRNLTDGFIAAASWDRRGTPKARRELVEVGLIEVVEGGVQMHDYLEHQRSAEQVAELRSKRAEAGSKGGKAKANRLALAKQMLKQTASKPVAETETDTEGPPLTRTPQGVLVSDTRTPALSVVTEELKSESQVQTARECETDPNAA